MSGTIELDCHRRRYNSPTEHLSLLGKLQHCTQGPFSLTWRQQEKRPRQRATRASNNGLAQAQVPMASCENLVIRPTDLSAK
jgi:hypothetical protein